MNHRHSLVRTAALSILLPLAACVTAGRPFDLAAADTITVGMTEAEVTAAMGAPQQVHVDDQGGRWLGWVYSRASIFRSHVQQFLVRITDGKVDSIQKHF
ncbi:MAG: hypothetical protein JNK78_11030 [Planctomycetes bacterium]|nr:hypothetical protein [Planctomycetota bacterium]